MEIIKFSNKSSIIQVNPRNLTPRNISAIVPLGPTKPPVYFMQYEKKSTVLAKRFSRLAFKNLSWRKNLAFNPNSRGNQPTFHFIDLINSLKKNPRLNINLSLEPLNLFRGPLQKSKSLKNKRFTKLILKSAKNLSVILKNINKKAQSPQIERLSSSLNVLN